jgi:hypothetical protein
MIAIFAAWDRYETHRNRRRFGADIRALVIAPSLKESYTTFDRLFGRKSAREIGFEFGVALRSRLFQLTGRHIFDEMTVADFRELIDYANRRRCIEGASLDAIGWSSTSSPCST